MDRRLLTALGFYNIFLILQVMLNDLTEYYYFSCYLSLYLKEGVNKTPFFKHNGFYLFIIQRSVDLYSDLQQKV